MRKQTLDVVLAGNAMKGDVLGAPRSSRSAGASRHHRSPELHRRNTLKRNGDVDHSRTAGSSRSVCSAQLGRTARWNRRASRARVRAASQVNAALLVLQIFRSVVDDPVARAAPAPADIIDRPSSIVAPNQTANNNPLKRNGDCLL